MFVQPLDVVEDRDALSFGIDVAQQSQLATRNDEAHARLDRVFVEIKYFCVCPEVGVVMYRYEPVILYSVITDSSTFLRLAIICKKALCELL